MYQVASKIQTILQNYVTKHYGLDDISFSVDIPSNTNSHAHLFTNIAFVLAKKLSRNPVEIAQNIKTLTSDIHEIKEAEIAGPGFINFYLSDAYIQHYLNQEEITLPQMLSSTRVLIEHSSPNLFKPFHIGHFVNNSYGESMARIYKELGADIVVLSFPSDVSVGIAKAVWGIKKLNLDPNNIDDLGKAYSFGVQEYEKDEIIKKQINTINDKIYKFLSGQFDNKNDVDIQIYLIGKNTSLAFFKQNLSILNSQVDEFIFESQAEQIGKKIVFENTPDIFEKSQGAYVFLGSKYGLFDNVFVNSQGHGTYLAKDLGLLSLKFRKYNPDLSITITDIEQKSHFDLVQKAASLINRDWTQKSKFLHHGRMNPKSGKFSSRFGTVPLAIDLIHEVKEFAKEKIIASQKGDPQDAIHIATAALKYNVLKVSMGKNIIWDKEQAFSFEGDTGIYLLYSISRTNSILKQVDFTIRKTNFDIKHLQINLVKELLKFDLIVTSVFKENSPHKLTKYLNTLASAFNNFYEKERILKSVDEMQKLMILLKFKFVMEKGLYLLGIKPVKSM